MAQKLLHRQARQKQKLRLIGKSRRVHTTAIKSFIRERAISLSLLQQRISAVKIQQPTRAKTSLRV